MTGILLGLSLLVGALFGWQGVVAVAAVATVSLIVQEWRATWLLVTIAFAIIGCVRVYDRPKLDAPEWVGGDLESIGTIVNGPVESNRSQFFEILVESNDGNGEAKLCSNAPLLPVARYGDLIWFQGVAINIDVLEPNRSGYFHSRGCHGSLDIRDFEVRVPGTGVRHRFDGVRRSLVGALLTAAPGDVGALMAGLVTGDDAALSYDKHRAFIVTGTSHITAVSGSNLAMIVSILTFMGHATKRGRSIWWQLFVIAMLWLYVAVIGFSPPPLRAAVVATLAFGALRFGRRPDFVTLSLAAATFELIVRPADFDSLAFRLSTISAIALVLGLSQRSPRGVKGWITHIVIGTAATTAATSILLIPIFERFAIFAIPANIVVATLCSLAFPFAFVAGLAGLFSQSLAGAIAAPATLPTALALWAVEALADLPFADAGAAIVAALPVWSWTVICLAIVIGLSRECRGGIVRFYREVGMMDVRSQSIIGISIAGGGLGLIVTLWLR